MTYTDYICANRHSFEEQLFDFLRIPSISAAPEHKPDMHRNADALRKKLSDIGLRSEIIETGSHPLVYAETPQQADAAVLLIYGHYDVQPPDPLELWTTPPFEPVVRDGSVYARGANDDKGQSLTHIFAVESLLQSEPFHPLNIKFIFEGEEEVGSDALHKYINTEEGRRKLACDCLLVSDTNQYAPGQPTITYGIRGIIALELSLTGPNRDLHSGIYGGAVCNPAVALTQILARFIDANGVIQVPAFYDDVEPLTARERKQFADLNFDEQAFYSSIRHGISRFGETGYTVNECRWARPSFDINGITAGYQGIGSKTIIPSQASAKLTFRLVPHQDPLKIYEAVKQFLPGIVPAGIDWQLEMQHGAGAMCLDLDQSKFVEPMARALQKVFGKPPVFTREGGSVPIVAECHQVLNADVLFVGWGQEDDAIHSPNEKFSLENFYKGIIASAEFLHSLAVN